MFALLGAWHWFSRTAVDSAISAVAALGGTASPADGFLYSVNFSSRSLQDSGLATLRPKFLAAQGPFELILMGTQVTDAGLSHLDGLPFLSVLNLTETEITGSGLAHLHAMGKVRHAEYGDTVAILLNGSKVDDTALPGLAKIGNLKFVSLSGTRCTAAGIARLKAARPALEIEFRSDP